MNKMERIAFGIGIVLAVLTAFVVSAVPPVNAATAYFVPENSSAESGDYVYVKLYVDIVEGETLGSGQTTILFDPAHANITKVSKNCNPAEDDTCFNNVYKNLSYTGNGYAWSFYANPLEWDAEEEEWVAPPGNNFAGPRTVKICRFKVEAQGTPGVSPFNFGFEQMPDACPICQKSKFNGQGGVPLENITWINGTFTHIGPQETFSKDLVPGWNLISLPLTATDMTVANVIDTSLSGSYDALYKYNATTHSFESLSSSDTMENGVGYFIHMTAADTWSYEGTACESIEVELSKGLNCVGWTNTSANLPDALSSIAGKYNYVARWNATSQSYEVYEPHAPSVFNDFWTMERGEGYWIAAKEDCTLTYPYP